MAVGDITSEAATAVAMILVVFILASLRAVFLVFVDRRIRTRTWRGYARVQRLI
jgi:hypothetical protein